jgi:hypothetical protein
VPIRAAARFGPIVTIGHSPLAFRVMIDRLQAHRTGLQHWLWLVLVACFALRSMVAPGYMPSIAAGSNKPLKLVICTAQGLKTISVSDGDSPPDGHGGGGTGGDCAFAGLGQPAHVACPSEQPGRHYAPSPPEAVAFVAPYAPLRRIGPQLGSRGPPARA